MTALIGRLVFDRILKETRENRQGRDDPYFEYVPTKKMSAFSSKSRFKKRQKALPPGLTPLEQDTLVKVKRRAYRLDMALGTCFGFKLGWGSLIGFLPGIGDVIDCLLSLMVVHTANEVGLPGSVILHMLFNVAFDFVIGLVPLLGDLADMAYKANTRNAVVLEDYLRRRGQEALRRSGQPQPPDPSLADVDVDDETSPERGAVSHPSLARPPRVHGAAGSASRGYSGARREYDPESHHGTHGGGGSGGGGRGEGRSSRHKGSRHKSRERERRDHQRPHGGATR